MRLWLGQRPAEIVRLPGAEHRIHVPGGDNIHAGIDKGRKGLLPDDPIIKDLDRIITPGPVFLADQPRQISVAQQLKLDRQRIERDRFHATLPGSLFPERHGAALREERPHPGEKPAIQRRMRLHRLLDDLDPQIDVIIAVHRRDDLDTGMLSYAIREAVDAFFQIQRARHAGQDRHLPLRPHRVDQQVRRCLTGAVVVQSQIGEALAMRRVGVPGDDRNAGADRCIDRIDTGSWIVARDRDAIDAARDHVFDHARLLGGVGGHRANIKYLD